MAAIGRRSAILVAAALFATLVVPARADGSVDVLATINLITRALADDNAPGAMDPFDKSFRDYAKLQDYFAGLTDRGQIVSEVDILDQSDSKTESKVTVRWTMTITNNSIAGDTEQRTAEIHLRLVPNHDSWKIVEFSPIDFFNPAPKTKRGA